MIEFCTVKRMVFTIAILGIVTIISVVIETKYEPKNRTIKNRKASSKTAVLEHSENTSTESSLCPTQSPKDSICKSCTKWEHDMSDSVCTETGYVTKVKCSESKTIYLSCEPPRHIRQRSFWIHEAIWLFIGVFSFLFVHFRRSSLDQKLLEKVNKQIASGV